MDLHDTGATVKYLIRDRDIKYTTALYAGFQNEGIATVKTGIRVPRMNAIKERWMRACRAELHDRTLTVHQSQLLHALREYESSYNEHRPHRALRALGTPASAPPTDNRTGPARPPRQPTTRSTPAASSTSTNMPLDLVGRRFRHPQG